MNILPPDDCLLAPEVAAVIATRNRATLLAKALRSLQEQTLPAGRFEVLVVDNASTDGTREIVRGFEHGPMRVRYLHEPRLGVSHARNRAILETGAPLMAYMDDDAWAAPVWLETVLSGFESEPVRPLAVGGRILLDWEVSRPSWLPDVALRLLGSVDYGPLPRALTPGETPFGANMAFERSFLLQRGGFDTRLGRAGSNLNGNEETALLRTLHGEGGLVLYLPDAVVHHLVPRERTRLAWLLRRMFSQGASDVIEAATARQDGLSIQRAARKLVANVWRRMRKLRRGHGRTDLFSLAASTAYQAGVLVQTAKLRLP